MNAGAKADMAGGWAVDVVAARIRPLARIAVCGAQQHPHLLALRDCRADHLDLSRRGAEKCLDGSFKLTASSNAARVLDGSARRAAN
jgi:hypothetical protein